ncbi:MAG: hypothetical protein PHP42_13515 [Bacteroidota bacterium]|nr:hypothetical protein [Bacteroidota bacterium]
MPSEILVVRTVELLGKVVGFADKDVLMRDLVHFVDVPVSNKIYAALFFEHGCHRMNDKTVFSSRFAGECNL